MRVCTRRNMSQRVCVWNIRLAFPFVASGKKSFFFFCMQAMNKEKQKANEEEEETEVAREYAKELKAEGRTEKKNPPKTVLTARKIEKIYCTKQQQQSNKNDGQGQRAATKSCLST